VRSVAVPQANSAVLNSIDAFVSLIPSKCRDPFR
jgi:hypothetical protein